jgi:Site-specific recombinases, DNA invertase Pin homologs
MLDEHYEEYRGMRALIMTRVSTPQQEDGYGHPAQEKACYEKLVKPLHLNVVRTIRDTYSGLEFRKRAVLDEILERAKHGEFDLFIVDVLDRLGRKGLERELWRMQLRATGIRLLSTDPEEHADDDSSWGELIRILKGIQAEDELKNIVRRTMSGKRAKAEGRQKDGTIGEKRLVANGPRSYGYKYTLDSNGKKVGFILNEDKFKDANGKEWTEPEVVRFIYESIANGDKLRHIAYTLNDLGISTPQ